MLLFLHLVPSLWTALVTTQFVAVLHYMSVPTFSHFDRLNRGLMQVFQLRFYARELPEVIWS